MPTVDAAIEPVLTALVNGLRELEVAFCIVGALVAELQLETKLAERTKDADAVVLVKDLAAFEVVKNGLQAKGFSSTKSPQRLSFQKGGLVDLLPYSDELAPTGVLTLPPDRVFNMAGFDCVEAAILEVTLDSGLVVPVAPLPLYAVLKLVAHSDRRFQKDLDAVEHLLRHYAQDDERLFGLEHNEQLVDYDYGPAYLLGVDGAGFVRPNVTKALKPLLDSLCADVTGTPAADGFGDEWEARREELFFWYRRGLGLE
jgi:predicted nucleotidyltransferase